MGASDLTTESPGTGNGEVVDGERPAASNGHVAKKRKRQKALATVAANGHVSKVVRRAPAGSNGAVVADEPPADAELGDAELEGATVESPAVVEVADGERNGATVEDPADAELDDARRNGTTVAAPADAELDEVEPAADDGGRRARKRAAKRAKADARQAAPGRRAAKRAKADERATPGARRAELVATAAEIAAAAAAAEEQPAQIGRKRAAKVARRLFALIAIAMIPASVYALAVTDGPTPSLSHADATFMSAQLMTADQRVRRRLVRLRPGQTSAALARTRDATLTARSLALELAKTDGADADLLRRALTLESAWLDAVGSVLSNPRSPLRDELVTRDGLLLPSLDALPVPEGRRKGGSKHLARYADSRIAAARRAKSRG